MRHPFRWLAAVTAFALAPKCVLCVLAYLGVGAAALGRAEICGASADSMGHAMVLWLVATGALFGGVALARHRRSRRRKSSPTDGA